MATQDRMLKEHEKGEDVSALQARLQELGYDVAEDERKDGFFGARTRAVVLEFQADHMLANSGVLDEETEKALARVRRVSSYTVSGSLTSSTAAHVLGGLTVELIDRNVGHDVTLATATTQMNGSFAFSNLILSQKSLVSRHKTKPDLQVRVLGAAGLLASSQVQYNAETKVRFTIALPAGVKGLASEVEALTAALKQAHAGNLATLQQTDYRQDITYLANKIGWDERAVAALAAAYKVSESTRPASDSASLSSIQPELLYALFRAGRSGGR